MQWKINQISSCLFIKIGIRLIPYDYFFTPGWRFEMSWIPSVSTTLPHPFEIILASLKKFSTSLGNLQRNSRKSPKQTVWRQILFLRVKLNNDLSYTARNFKKLRHCLDGCHFLALKLVIFGTFVRWTDTFNT